MWNDGHVVRLGHRRDPAGTDDVVGIKTHIHEMGNLLEFMAIGTAVSSAAPSLATFASTAWRLALAWTSEKARTMLVVAITALKPS